MMNPSNPYLILLCLVFIIFTQSIQAGPEDLFEKANRLEAQLSSPVPISSMVLLDKRDDIPLDVFYSYWRDVHGVLVAQSPLEEIGRHYWQYHLLPSDPNLWPDSDGLSVIVPADEQIEGIAMATFSYSADAAAAVLSKEKVKKIRAQIMQDEKNIFKGTYAFMALGENTVELIDKREEKIFQGNSDNYHLIALLRKKEGFNQNTFQAYVREKIVDELLKEGSAIYVKLHLWEDQHLTSEESPDVDNRLPTEKSYHAALELVYSSYEKAYSALNASATKTNLATQSNFLGAVAVYPIKSAYSLAYHGKPTLMGLRGYPIAETINRVGAENQKQLEVLKTVYGENISLYR